MKPILFILLVTAALLCTDTVQRKIDRAMQEFSEAGRVLNPQRTFDSLAK